MIDEGDNCMRGEVSTMHNSVCDAGKGVVASSCANVPLVPGTPSALSTKSSQHKSTVAKILNIAFWLVVLCAAAVLLSLGVTSKGAPKTLFGYSVFRVLTSSMQQEIPQGSLVLTHHVNPATIKVGDVVTYLTGATSTITHEVRTIYPNYEGSGQYGFQTKGTENISPDPEIVYGANVVGVVVGHLYVGGLPAWAQAHLLLCAIVAVALICVLVAIILLRGDKTKVSYAAGNATGKTRGVARDPKEEECPTIIS